MLKASSARPSPASPASSAGTDALVGVAEPEGDGADQQRAAVAPDRRGEHQEPRQPAAVEQLLGQPGRDGDRGEPPALAPRPRQQGGHRPQQGVEQRAARPAPAVRAAAATTASAPSADALQHRRQVGQLALPARHQPERLRRRAHADQRHQRGDRRQRPLPHHRAAVAARAAARSGASGSTPLTGCPTTSHSASTSATALMTSRSSAAPSRARGTSPGGGAGPRRA